METLNGMVPSLIVAAQQLDLDVVKCLVETGANINHLTLKIQMGTALMRAASNRAWHVVSFLLDHGADLDLKDSEGRTALNWAAWWDAGK
jgi:ankyrin repeat protein